MEVADSPLAGEMRAREELDLLLFVSGGGFETETFGGEKLQRVEFLPRTPLARETFKASKTKQRCSCLGPSGCEDLKSTVESLDLLVSGTLEEG